VRRLIVNQTALMRITPGMKHLTLLGLAIAVLAVPASPAHGGAPTCQGQEATIVAVDGEATGTEGDDVIVATGGDGLFTVSALGGDDLICVDGRLVEDSDTGGPDVSGGPGYDSLRVRVGDGNDFLVVSEVEDLDIAMGGGFDELRLDGAQGSGTLDGGAQSAVIKLTSRVVDLDLEDHVLRLDGGVGAYEVDRFSRVAATGRRVSLTGDARDNGFRASACRLTVRGGKGDDVLEAYAFSGAGCRGARLLGNKGDDRIKGTSGDDTLIGGPGFDRVHGKQGDDRCEAERRIGCELP
jgi:hypothetical protein